MGLQFDPMTGKILYLGKEVGQYTFEDGRGRVHVDIAYECEVENWILPLSWFDYGLHMLPSVNLHLLSRTLSLRPARTA